MTPILFLIGAVLLFVGIAWILTQLTIGLLMGFRRPGEIIWARLEGMWRAGVIDFDAAERMLAKAGYEWRDGEVEKIRAR